jgi:hypothetical protein
MVYPASILRCLKWRRNTSTNHWWSAAVCDKLSQTILVGDLRSVMRGGLSSGHQISKANRLYQAICVQHQSDRPMKALWGGVCTSHINFIRGRMIFME